jgi:phosphoribosylanthranilate isomerase
MLETAGKVNRILSVDFHHIYRSSKGLPRKLLIQIYEIQNRDEARAMVEIGIDHIGSVLTQPEPSDGDELVETIREVSAAGKMSSLIPLFRDVEQISRALDRYCPDIVHFCETLYGNGNQQQLTETFDRQNAIRRRFPEIKIMRSIPIGQTGYAKSVPSLDIARSFESISDYFLTDTLLKSVGDESDNQQPVEGFVGITGITCDWQVAKALVLESSIPVILAGGISPENVSDGIQSVTPAGVDSCTLTNAVDGNGKTVRFRKDLEKVKRLVANVRQTDMN